MKPIMSTKFTAMSTPSRRSWLREPVLPLIRSRRARRRRGLVQRGIESTKAGQDGTARYRQVPYEVREWKEPESADQYEAARQGGVHAEGGRQRNSEHGAGYGPRQRQEGLDQLAEGQPPPHREDPGGNRCSYRCDSGSGGQPQTVDQRTGPHRVLDQSQVIPPGVFRRQWL